MADEEKKTDEAPAADEESPPEEVQERRPSKWKQTASKIPWAVITMFVFLIAVILTLYFTISRLVESTAPLPVYAELYQE